MVQVEIQKELLADGIREDIAAIESISVISSLLPV